MNDYTYNPYIDMYSNYLAHHGILGMKWGVRRYQNPDGSLTAAGRKHYGGMSDKKLYKTLKKSIRSERAKQYGGFNRWMHDAEIGEHSKKIRDEYKKNYKQYSNSKEYKEYMKKWDKLDEDVESGKIDMDEYEKMAEKLYDSKPKRNFTDLSFAVQYSLKGKKYLNDYLNKGGKELTTARIQDLGFDKKTAQEFTDRLIKSNLTLGDI